jgi:hypothetical protein
MDGPRTGLHGEIQGSGVDTPGANGAWHSRARCSVYSSCVGLLCALRMHEERHGTVMIAGQRSHKAVLRQSCL